MQEVRVQEKGPGWTQGSSERSELDGEQSPLFEGGNRPRCGPEPCSLSLWPQAARVSV